MSNLVTGSAPIAGIGSFGHSWFKREPALARLTLVTIAFIPVLLLLLGMDDRQTNDINVWRKPLKFHIATALYIGTLVWFAGYINRSLMTKWWYRSGVYALVGCVFIELLWLWFAASLAEPAHYNRTHPILAPAYPIIGVIAVILTSGTLLYAALIAFNKQSVLSAITRYSIVAGLVISFFSTVFIAGELASMDSHWIGGTTSDADGLWLFGWSRDGGDLRVAHFFSLHAMQFIPLIALVPAPKVLTNRPYGYVLILSLAYTAVLVFTYLQAKMGMPFLGWL
ncbi:MAG: hypothetical protein KTR35_12195 [Gammaproteobacteria bacterium]|nr:hypothetical protein [Gammaproteobacteria bacterium]